MQKSVMGGWKKTKGAGGCHMLENNEEAGKYAGDSFSS